MTRSSPEPTPMRAGDLPRLIDLLHRTHLRISRLTGGRVDAVTHPSGATYPLPDAETEMRREALVARQRAAERIAILDSLPVQVAILDGDGAVVAVNGDWQRFADAEPDPMGIAILGRRFVEVYCGGTVEGGGPEGRTTAELAAGLDGVLSGAQGRFDIEYRHQSGTETPRWFLLTVTPLKGSARSGAAVMRLDVTGQHEAHAEAQRLQRLLGRLIDQAKVGILVHRNFVPLLGNRELARMFGYADPAAILELADCRALFSADEHDRIDAYNTARMQGDGTPWLCVVRGLRKDGAFVMIESRAFTIDWDGQLAVCAMFSDITAQLETEEQLRLAQRLDAVGQLTGGIAHDFNNLLTVILGNAEILSGSLDDPELRLLADATASAAERGAELTGQLLAFARRQPLDGRPTDVAQRLLPMDRLLRRTLGANIAIRITAAEGLWHALVDPGQLENALLNLCINARDAMPQGGTLTIEAENSEFDAAAAARHGDLAPGQYVSITVTDTGVGMTPETLARAFEPFFTTKEIGRGSGLGLSMVYGFAKQSMGHVRIRSQPGRGTRVQLLLPRAAVEEDIAAPPPDRTGPPRGTEKILLVEDDELVRHHVGAMLAALGYEVVAAAGGTEALSILEGTADFRLLFTDIMMPGDLGGLQLADAARRLYPDLPVLFTSGYAEPAITPGDLADRDALILRKPYRRQDLAAILREVLSKAD